MDAIYNQRIMLQMKFISPIFFLLFMLLILPEAIGQQAANERDEQGRRQGPWSGHFPSGRTRYKGQFKDDQPIGVFRYFNNDGSLRVELQHQYSGDTVNAIYYHSNRRVLSEGFFLNRKRQGTWTFFTEMGVKVAENYYHQDAEHGKWKTFFPNGSLAEIVTWENGSKHGPWIQYFEDGNYRLKASYKDNMLHGDFTVYYQNNQKVLQAHYYQSLPDNTWRYYSSSGELEKEVYYSKGRMIKEVIHIERQQDETIPVEPGINPSRDIFDPAFGM
jgi:antitoxin component YwqK of YwqJK toxin-antitoxin module